MIFTEGFLEIIIYGSLLWCGLTGLGLAGLLLRDRARGEIW